MAEFICSVCGATFKLPDAVLQKYPNWQPKYCHQHSPKKKLDQKEGGGFKKRSAPKSELDLPLEEVLRRFSEGPDSGVFTDGSARPNPGPGGWGVVHVDAGNILGQRYGSEAQTTNNRMELRALIEAYTMISSSDKVTVYTDSELCCNIVNKWAAGWEKRGWKRKDGPIKNLDLVQELYALTQTRPEAQLKWVKAHNGWLWNEYADSLATAWARSEL